MESSAADFVCSLLLVRIANYISRPALSRADVGKPAGGIDLKDLKTRRMAVKLKSDRRARLAAAPAAAGATDNYFV